MTVCTIFATLKTSLQKRGQLSSLPVWLFVDNQNCCKTVLWQVWYMCQFSMDFKESKAYVGYGYGPVASLQSPFGDCDEKSLLDNQFLPTQKDVFTCKSNFFKNKIPVLHFCKGTNTMIPSCRIYTISIKEIRDGKRNIS